MPWACRNRLRRLRPNVTVNAGVRYEYYTPNREKDNRVRLFDAATVQLLDPRTSFYQADKKAFGPRLGLTWAPARLQGKTVVRIGGGIDMSTSNGVALTGTAGLNPQIGFFGLDFGNTVADGLTPVLGANIGGAITVGLKPGIINVVPVTKKEYKGAEPWVSVSNLRIKIDGCVGESFIRSYATLMKSTDEGDAILSWYGVTKKV